MTITVRFFTNRPNSKATKNYNIKNGCFSANAFKPLRSITIRSLLWNLYEHMFKR